MSTLVISAAFKYNQDYIIKELCENRAKPMIKCNGKCYLKKQLEQQENKNKNVPVVETENTINWIVLSQESSLLSENDNSISQDYFKKLIAQTYLTVEEHPPTV